MRTTPHLGERALPPIELDAVLERNQEWEPVDVELGDRIFVHVGVDLEHLEEA
jgi:hydrogenase maturation factor